MVGLTPRGPAEKYLSAANSKERRGVASLGLEAFGTLLVYMSYSQYYG